MEFLFLVLQTIQCLGTLWMLYKGTFIKERLFDFAKFALGLMVLGMIFKIMHLKGADEMIVFSNGGLLVLYSIHFVRKTSKQRLDYLKMLLTICLTILPIIILLHLVPRETGFYIRTATAVLTIITFIEFLYTTYIKKDT